MNQETKQSIKSIKYRGRQTKGDNKVTTETVEKKRENFSNCSLNKDKKKTGDHMLSLYIIIIIIIIIIMMMMVY